jgi:hypothetical protein
MVSLALKLATAVPRSSSGTSAFLDRRAQTNDHQPKGSPGEEGDGPAIFEPSIAAKTASSFELFGMLKVLAAGKRQSGGMDGYVDSDEDETSELVLPRSATAAPASMSPPSAPSEQEDDATVRHVPIDSDEVLQRWFEDTVGSDAERNTRSSRFTGEPCARNVC